ncbi:aldo/keto reductase [Aquimarina mytili]
MSLENNFQSAKKLIHKAIDLGVNFFDTADLYNKGQNEVLVGEALKGYRDKVILATKVGNEWRDNGSGWDWNPSKDYILKSVDQSLQRMQTDYIDLYQLHGGTMDDPIDETIEAFEILQQQGKIRFYGISSIRPNVIREYVKRSNIVSVMMQYSLLDRRPEEECLKLLQKNNIGVLARGVLAKGLLAGKTSSKYLDYTKAEVEETIQAVKEISEESKPICQTSIQYVLKHSAISSAVIGVRTEKQVEECFFESNQAELLDMDRTLLQNSNKALVYANHR